MENSLRLIGQKMLNDNDIDMADNAPSKIIHNNNKIDPVSENIFSKTQKNEINIEDSTMIGTKVVEADNNDDRYLKAIKKKGEIAILKGENKLIKILKLKSFEKIISLIGKTLNEYYYDISFGVYSCEEIIEQRKVLETISTIKNDNNIQDDINMIASPDESVQKIFNPGKYKNNNNNSENADIINNEIEKEKIKFNESSIKNDKKDAGNKKENIIINKKVFNNEFKPSIEKKSKGQKLIAGKNKNPKIDNQIKEINLMKIKGRNLIENNKKGLGLITKESKIKKKMITELKTEKEVKTKDKKNSKNISNENFLKSNNKKPRIKITQKGISNLKRIKGNELKKTFSGEFLTIKILPKTNISNNIDNKSTSNIKANMKIQFKNDFNIKSIKNKAYDYMNKTSTKDFYQMNKNRYINNFWKDNEYITNKDNKTKKKIFMKFDYESNKNKGSNNIYFSSTSSKSKTYSGGIKNKNIIFSKRCKICNYYFPINKNEINLVNCLNCKGNLCEKCDKTHKVIYSGHNLIKIKFIFIKDAINYDNIKIPKLICSNCKKYNFDWENIYFCNNCKIFLCKECEGIHQNNNYDHEILLTKRILINDKNSIKNIKDLECRQCSRYLRSNDIEFGKCDQCKFFLCAPCSESHLEKYNNHNIIYSIFEENNYQISFSSKTNNINYINSDETEKKENEIINSNANKNTNGKNSKNNTYEKNNFTEKINSKTKSKITKRFNSNFPDNNIYSNQNKITQQKTINCISCKSKINDINKYIYCCGYLCLSCYNNKKDIFNSNNLIKNNFGQNVHFYPDEKQFTQNIIKLLTKYETESIGDICYYCKNKIKLNRSLSHFCFNCNNKLCLNCAKKHNDENSEHILILLKNGKHTQE